MHTPKGPKTKNTPAKMMAEEKKEDQKEDLEFITVNDSDDETVQSSIADSTRSGEDSETLLSSVQKTFIGASKHPVAAFFHVFFKTLAIVLYLFGTMISDSFIFIFVICILLLAFDFWTVKNVTGRLLVGLRWWNKIREDGSNQWIFESHDDEGASQLDPRDARIFWTGLYIPPALWAVFLLVSALKFQVQWAILVVVALVLSAANIVGYVKCRKDARQKVESFVAQSALGALSSNAGKEVWNRMMGTKKDESVQAQSMA